MACGCLERCNCSIIAGLNVVVSGSGDPGDPYVISASETTFAATSSDNSILITPGGATGHNPDLRVNIDSNPSNLAVETGAGLFVGSSAVAGAVLPVGIVVDYAGAVAPAGWLVCDGSGFSAVTYPSLAAVLGSTTLPDYRGRSGVGIGTNADNNALFDNDGLAVAARTNNHLHTHAHDHTIPNHQHTVGVAPALTTGANSSNQTGVGASGTQAEWDKVGATTDDPDIEALVGFNTGTTVALVAVDVAADGHTHTLNGGLTGNDGGGGTTGGASTANTSTTPVPYITVNKIIYTGV